jgi:F-type H+-transporting ATPase subunit delta
MALVAGRYARAFAEVITAQELDGDKTAQELDDLAAMISESHDLRNIFQNPAVEHKQKLGLLDAVMKQAGGPKLLRNFMAVLIDHNHIGQMKEIARMFRRELDARMGIADAQVTSARELSATEKKDLEKQLATVTGKKVRATYSEDAELLGGAIVRVGSTIYDGSVRGQLEKIKQQIATA